jgi:hypothetical protein
VGVETGDVASFEAGATSCLDWVLGVLANLEGDPGVLVVSAPDTAFVLET